MADELGLVIKSVADDKGLAQTRDGLRQVTQEAEKTQQALSPRVSFANDLVKQLAQAHGNTAEAFKQAQATVAQSLKVTPSITPAGAGLAAAAVAKAAATNPTGAEVLYAQNLAKRMGPAATQKAAQAEKGIGESLSESTVVRFGAALVGVGLGLNIAAGAARLVHDQIEQAVFAQRDLELATRAVTAELGSQATSATAASKAFVADPTTRGTASEFLQAVGAMQQLTAEFGLNQTQVLQLATSSGQLARIQGIEFPTAAKAVQAAVQGNVEALSQYGISLVNEVGYVKSVGYSYEELVGLYGRAQASQILLRDSTAAIAAENAKTKDPTDKLAVAFDNLGKAADAAKLKIGEALKGPFTVIINVLTRAITDQSTDAQLVGDTGPGPAPATLALLKARQAAEKELGLTPNFRGGFRTSSGAAVSTSEGNAQIDRYLRDLEVAITAQNAFAYANESAAKTVVGETTAIVGQAAALQSQTDLFTANRTAILEATQAIQVYEAERAKLNAISTALAGPDFTRSLADIQAQGAQTAGADILAQRAQQRAREASALFREQLVVSIGLALDPASKARAEQELSDFDRRAQARTAQGQAGEAGVLAARAQADARAQLTALELQQQQRQLAAAQPLADLRAETLNREGAIVDLQRQEADLADRITVASRNNLDLVRAQAEARLAALPSSQALNDNTYEQQRLLLRIQAIRTDVQARVLPVSALDEIPDDIARIRALRFAQPRLALDAAEGQRPVDLLAREAEREQQQQVITLSVLEGQKRVLDDQLTPLLAAQRLTDERTAAIQRQLELQLVGETSARTAASQALLTANVAALAADVAVRKAQEWAANINDGLTNIQRAWQLLSTLPQPPPPVPPGGLFNPDRREPPGPALPAGPAPQAPYVLPAVSSLPLATYTPPGPSSFQGAGGTRFALPRQDFAAQSINDPSRGRTWTITGPITIHVNGAGDPNATAQAVLRLLDGAVDSAPQASSVGLSGAFG